MRLIRLTSKNLTGYFDCDFNQDVILEPNSKIALHSFTSQFNRFEIIITAQNDSILFAVDGPDSMRTISLPNGIWNNANINDFFTLATQIFNRTMENTTNELGRQWFVGTSENRFTFQCMKGTIFSPSYYNNPKFSNFIRLQNAQAVGTPNVWKRNGGTVGSNDSFVYYKSTQCKGSSSFRSKIMADPNPVTAGYILAYSSTSIPQQTTVIDPSTIAYGIRYVDTGQPYKIIINGVETATTTTAVLNDAISIDTYGGYLFLHVYRVGLTNPITLHSNAYDHYTNYFPVSVFVGTTQVGGILFTSDYFYNRDNPPTEDIDIMNDIIYMPPLSSKTTTNNFLQFDDVLLSQELGYRNFRYPSVGYKTEVNSIYTGENAFKLRDFSESYIIEMLNLNIDSYDSLTKQHKNFLAVIPQVAQVREQVVYVAPNLIWLDINNAFPLVMRQFKARVLKEDLSPIESYGLSQITVIVKNLEE
jgi:hypothetical protein